MFRKARQAQLGSSLISLFILGFLCLNPVMGVHAAESRTDGQAPEPIIEGTDQVGTDQPPVAPSLEVAPDDSGKSTLILEGWEAGSILGKEVRGTANEKLGRIIDVIVDRKGATRAAVIDFGGFLGVGSRKIAVAWHILVFTGPGDEERITVQATRDRLNAAPEFKEGKPITVLGAREDAATKVTLQAPEW